jgi:hypothetical protein
LENLLRPSMRLHFLTNPMAVLLLDTVSLSNKDWCHFSAQSLLFLLLNHPAFVQTKCEKQAAVFKMYIWLVLSLSNF